MAPLTNSIKVAVVSKPQPTKYKGLPKGGYKDKTSNSFGLPVDVLNQVAKAYR